MTHEDQMNVEANVFAMHLLVPDFLLAKEDLDSLDWTDDRALKALARKFGVTLGVMFIRIAEYRKKQR